MEQQGPNKAVIGIIVVVLLAGIGGGVAYLANQNNTPTGQLDGSTSSLNTSSSTASANSNATYKDGTYDASANFQTPDGIDGITVKVTIANNVITSVSADTTASSRESQQYDDAFLSSYKSEVVGKNVNEVHLNRTAGASLTSDGFNKALDEIRQNANA